MQGASKHILVISSGAVDSLQEDLAFFGLGNALEFPSWETLPGEEIPPSLDIVGKRLQTLHALLTKPAPHLIVCPLQALLQKLPEPEGLRPLLCEWRVGDAIAFATLPVLLTSLGYHKRPMATNKGEFALRGGILDLFPCASPTPFRIEFLGDAIDQIRTYDPVGQTSTGRVSSLLLTPAHELLSQNPCLLFKYLDPGSLLVFNDLLSLEDRCVALQSLPQSRTRWFAQMQEVMEQARSMHTLFWSEQPIEALSEVQMTSRAGRAFYTGAALQPLHFQCFSEQIETARWLHPFLSIPDFFSPVENRAAATPEELMQGLSRHKHTSMRPRFIASSEAERTLWQERIAPVVPNPHFELGYLSSGFVIEEQQLTLFPMTEFTHQTKVRRQRWRHSTHAPSFEFHTLQAGDLVVHFQNGIGKYLGIEQRPNHLGTPVDFMVIEYAQESKLYVPLSQAHLVNRYIGASEESPPLNVLGSSRWQQMRTKTQKAILGYAKQLLQREAQRKLCSKTPLPPDSEEMAHFEAEFPFAETEDQKSAICAVKQSLCSPKAMDMLICGDVGYGKTEVAMRAAFKAVVDGGKQVAMLVPTTLLAMQHLETFSQRMANHPIQIASLSRFSTPQENRHTLQQVAAGTIDILIGTLRMISKDVQFKNLGLLIIDEEQRFGVRAKEALRALQVGVDCLTLSATPIPRTLYLSLMGSREICLINTPPQDRLPIKSILCERESGVIQNALLRELSREGQAFVIHNRIETIHLVAKEVQALLPEAKLLVVHGQMPTEEIDAIFHAFKNGTADILIATALIENGIDIPNANTILVDRAEQFGLADLYQFRGRVGRWNRPAFAYFLTSKSRSPSDTSRRRLHALLDTQGFSSGMKIAMRDLEIRGAGDILGTEQSGQVSSIGFHLYCKLLKRTMDALKKEEAVSFTETKMEFPYNAYIPEQYIDEISLRMEIYHRLGDATSFEEIDALLKEIQDRFGPIPNPLRWLYHLSRIKLLASKRQFLLLKLTSNALLTEQQVDGQVVPRTLPLRPESNPAKLEAQIVALL